MNTKKSTCSISSTADNKKAAIKRYQLSTEKFTDKADNEAFKALEELQSKN